MPEYNFHANAIGVGGTLTFGGRRVTIPSAAASVLSPAGGEGYAVAEAYDANGVAFTRAESRVVGAEIGDGIFYTYADVMVTNFTVFDRLNIPRLRIAMMNAQMTSVRNVEMPESQFEVRLSYRGIAIDGVEIEPAIDIDLCGASTFAEVTEALNRDPEGAVRRFGETAVANAENTRTLEGSLVKSLHGPDGAVVHGCALRVPNVGLARLGEFSFQPGDRKLRLLRLKLKSGPFALAFSTGAAANEADAESGGGDEGDIVSGALEGNGTPPTGG